MSMSIIGRLNIGGSPQAPVMQSEGVMVYRATLGTLRKANFNAGTDVALGNINHTTAGVVYSACIVNNNYVGIEHVGYVSPGGAVYMTANNLDTGVYNVRQIPPGTTVLQSYGVTRQTKDSGNAGVCILDQAVARAGVYWINVPTGVMIKYQIQQATRLWGNNILQNANTIPAGANQFIGVRMDGVVNSNFATGLTYDATQGGITLFSPFQQAGFPWFFEQDTTYLYYHRAHSAAPFHEFIVRHHKITNVKEYSDLGVYLNVQPNAYDALKITVAFDRIHFTSFSPRYRFYSSPLWPVTKTDSFIDIDTLSPSIRAIWIYPPFIYLAKDAGGTYGNQLIKIYDSALDSQRKNIYLGCKPKMRFIK